MTADPRDEVSVVDDDPSWRARFMAERDSIVDAPRAVAPPLALIEHVGSTAVPGLAAKPIIDIMVAREGPPEREQVSASLARIGYEHVPKPESTENSFFRHGETLDTTIHPHITIVESPFGLRMLRFRDALRASPRLAADSEVFKRQLAERFPHDRPSYTRAKGPFIRSALGRHPGRNRRAHESR